MIELSQGQFQLSNNPPYYLFRNNILTNLYGTSNSCWQRFLNNFIFLVHVDEGSGFFHPHLCCVHHRSSSPLLTRPGETLPLTSPGRRWFIYSNLNSFGCPVVFDVCSKIARGSDILRPAGAGAARVPGGLGPARPGSWEDRGFRTGQERGDICAQRDCLCEGLGWAGILIACHPYPPPTTGARGHSPRT